MKEPRPKTANCFDCNVLFDVPSKGRVRKRCLDCTLKHNARNNAKNMRKSQGYTSYQNTSEGFDLAVRTTDMRLAIELSIPLLNMALLRPDLADRYIKQAIDHLENGRGGAKVDIRDKTDISVISIIDTQTNYQGDPNA